MIPYDPQFHVLPSRTRTSKNDNIHSSNNPRRPVRKNDNDPPVEVPRQHVVIKKLEHSTEVDGYPIRAYSKADIRWSPHLDAESWELHAEFDPATEVQPCDPGRFKPVRQVADAERNRGTVVLMYDTLAGCHVIAKIMPNWWVGSCHAEFVANHPDETEFPWQDIGCMKFLAKRSFPHGSLLLGVYRDDKKTEVVTAFATEGDLFTWCSHPERPPIGPQREELMRPIVMQLLSGVQQLHDISIVHRDISLENLLVTKIGQEVLRLLIIDFGMSSTSRYSSGQPRGKKSYQAPEVHEPGFHDGFLSDAFAVGVVTYCVLVNDYPWLSTRPGADKCFAYAKAHGFRNYVEKRKLRNTNISVASILSEPALQLLEGLLTSDPTKRLTLGEEAWGLDGAGAPRRSVWDEEWAQGNHNVDRSRSGTKMPVLLT